MLAILSESGSFWLQNDFYFTPSSNASGQLPASLQPVRKKTWFSKDYLKTPSTAFDRKTTFCDLISIMTMFWGSEKLDCLIATVRGIGWYMQDPRKQEDLLYFHSAARQGNTTLAHLYFSLGETISKRVVQERDSFQFPIE